MARKYFPKESRLVYEWLQKNYPRCLQWRRVRLGPIPKGDIFYQVVRRWADAVVFCGDKVIIVEAKIKADAGALGQLELYRELFPKTPEFSQLKDYPIELVFLTAFRDPQLEKLAKKKGIRYVVYCPKWLKEALGLK